ncbi:phosphoesterase [Vallitalea longa]|uniref:Phosphoesterase n=1 Tax=Vallitalea longa TaxID=2936439 RepID=A0A9W6DGX9_9FIRM|nr:metallophosphoesterase [Vallitalea longa]GKX30992.1 phosphoesterase [Vallitalea longa]
MKKPKRRYIISLVVLIIVVITICAFNKKMKTSVYSISSPKINSKIKIALITDLHSCQYGKNQNTLINEINKQKPDLVLYGGDICDDKLPHDNTELLLKAIANKYPSFYVSGNHEFLSGEVNNIKDMFRSYGVTVLEGTYETIEINEQKINICGIDDPNINQYANKNTFYNQLESLESVSDNGYYTILLAHRPQYISTYLSYNFDLVLAGHTHGGQWRIPWLLNGLFAPDQKWFPKYSGGRYNFENGEMIISRGLARESTRVPRIFNRPELVIIDLK